MKAISDDVVKQKCIQTPWITERRGEIKFGNIPEWLENTADMMPAGSKEQQDYRDAAELARSCYRDQVKAQLDPSKVADMCCNEPWTTAKNPLEVIGSRFGYVTEKLEHAAKLFPDGSAEQTAYIQAFEAGKQIYFQSMKEFAYRGALGKSRAEIEGINSQLWQTAHKLEGDGTYRSARLVKLCELLGHFQQNLNINVRQPGVHQYVAKGK
ncbi:MAG: hypothetical protein HYS17_07610 [Micavibrio aeruginosavorus]|uniref:Uncharacterized protein n=1 Tax=Micavibrio aeruginosavorus TaxID=349221 RepID=A0A7T5R0S1_9BACT|nr:MAG: hypothetical protein HYS17_07610 [Micavibrio aeruginosavorus]